ncbi:MAG: hypothetical protein RIM72_15570 [Alphaproteobacteria bacterium]
MLSCTDMRSVEVVERSESDLGKPVITSNQAMHFCALSAIGVDPPEVACGRLCQKKPG